MKINIDKIVYQEQPHKSKKCGQTVLAMLLGGSTDMMCAFLSKTKGTYNKDIYKILDLYRVKYRYKRFKSIEQLPKLAIVKIGFSTSTSTHWTLRINGKFYDPDLGIIDKYNLDHVRFMSYIEVI